MLVKAFVSVRELVKPSIVSKPVPYTNVHNVRNISSSSQLVKIFNVTKSVCSSNTINSVICNSTRKPVSNFVSDFQSVKPVHKLIDVKRKRLHEQLVTNKDKHQHDFTKPISVVNILIVSIHFYEFFYFLYFILTLAITVLTIVSKTMSSVITFLLWSF